jgi:hypothetical protein
MCVIYQWLSISAEQVSFCAALDAEDVALIL